MWHHQQQQQLWLHFSFVRTSESFFHQITILNWTKFLIQHYAPIQGRRNWMTNNEKENCWCSNCIHLFVRPHAYIFIHWIRIRISMYNRSAKVKTDRLSSPSGYGRRLMYWRSWIRIPALFTGWTFFTYFCCKNCNVCLQRRK